MVFASLCSAQTQDFDIQFPWNHDVLQIKEDSIGYIWFHDGKDYYRYNGHNMYACELADVIGKKKYDYDLIGEIIFVQHELLISIDNSVKLFHPFTKSIKTIWTPPQHVQVEYMYEDDIGDIWLFNYNKVNNTRPVYLSKDGFNFTYLMDLPEFNEDTGIFWEFEVTDKNGTLYIHDRLGGLLILTKDGTEQTLELRDKQEFIDKYPCSQFRLDNKNTLWRIYDTDYEIYDEALKAFVKHPMSGNFGMQNFCNRNSGLALLNLRSIFEDSQGRIWLNNAASYLLLHQEENQFLSFRKDLVDNLEGGAFDIDGLLEDKNGNIWGFKSGGVFKIRDKTNYFKSFAVNTYKADHPIYQDTNNATLLKILDFYDDFAIKNTAVHSIAEDDSNNIYFQDGTLTFRIDARTNKLDVLPFFTEKEKVHLYLDNDARFYSCWDNYYSFDRNFKSTRRSIRINKIEKTFRQRNGTLWFLGLLDQHTNMFGKVNTSSLEYEGNFQDADGNLDFSDLAVNDMDEDEEGHLWLASEDGIYQLNTINKKISRVQDFCTYGDEKYTFSNKIDQLIYDKYAHLWFKSKYEIGYLNTNSSTLIHLLPINENFYGPDAKIVSYGDSVIWIGNKLGIAYHNFNSRLTFQVSNTEGIDTKGAVNVMKKLTDGNLIAGTNNGLYQFHPDSLLLHHLESVEHKNETDLNLTRYSYVSGKTDSLISLSGNYNSNHKIELNYNDKLLSLEYSLINFSQPHLHKYQHWLEGYEQGWSKSTNKSEMSYSSLPAGDYTFKVRGNVGSGSWSKDILEVEITIKPAWYNTWLARILIIGIISLMIYTFLWNRYRQILKFEKLRSDISRDLHDDVGTLLTGISMQSQLLERMVDTKNKHVANKIASKSREAMDRMRDTVWAIDSRRDTSSDLYDRILDYAHDALLPKDIRLHLNTEIRAKEYKLKPNIRQNVYLIAKESINNIAKHSDTPEVFINLAIQNNHLSLQIKDKGSEQSSKSSGQGLSNMKQRAQKIQANYSFVYKNGYITNLDLAL